MHCNGLLLGCRSHRQALHGDAIEFDFTSALPHCKRCVLLAHATRALPFCLCSRGKTPWRRASGWSSVERWRDHPCSPPPPPAPSSHVLAPAGLKKVVDCRTGAGLQGEHAPAERALKVLAMIILRASTFEVGPRLCHACPQSVQLHRHSWCTARSSARPVCRCFAVCPAAVVTPARSRRRRFRRARSRAPRQARAKRVPGEARPVRVSRVAAAQVARKPRGVFLFGTPGERRSRFVARPVRSMSALVSSAEHTGARKK